MERLMMTVPNFAPRGVGFRFTEAQVFITTTAATPTEILAATMRQIRCPPFRKRFNEYIESEENPMTYINEKHRARFELVARNVHRENYAVLSALYLLTADQRLWSCCKHHINNGCVFFENIRLNNCTERAYTLYCAAKDLTLGTKHLIENNHPAIIDAGTFARVQEEIARRSGKPKVKQKGTKTELSRYSSKYALSELLICGECRTPYRRCTWTAKGKRKIVWRCINRLDYGKKYCHHSPSIEESLLQDAVMRAIMQTAKQNIEVLKTLKIHIGMGLTDEVTEDKTLDIQIRIAEIDAEFQKMLKAVSADNADGIDEERITELMNEKQRLTVQLEQYAAIRQKRESAKSRLDEIFTILDAKEMD